MEGGRIVWVEFSEVARERGMFVVGLGPLEPVAGQWPRRIYGLFL